MTEDHNLNEARTRVKEFDLGPVPDIDLAALVRGGHRQRRRLIADRALAVAALLILAIGLGVGVTHLGTQPDSTVGPTPTGAAPDVTPTTESPSPTVSPTIKEADCRAGDLTASVDTQLTDGAGGTQQVVLLFTNTGTSACWLGGFPALTGETSSGVTMPLAFQTSSDLAIADPSPATGPGNVAPGHVGALHLTLQNRDCATTAPHFTRLHITLPGGQPVTMPFPDALQVTACWGNEAPIGPVAVDAQVSPTTAGGTCSGVAIDVAPGVKGAANPQAAIDAFLRSGSTSLTLPHAGWVSTPSGQYTSGTAVIEMSRLPDGGYVVTGARTC
jgi:hypothetical protein